MGIILIIDIEKKFWIYQRFEGIINKILDIKIDGSFIEKLSI